MNDIYSPQHFIQQKPQRRISRLVLCALLFVAVLLFIGKNLAGHEIVIDKTGNNSSLWGRIAGVLPFAKQIQDDPDYVMPSKESNRLDILVLGMRGADDPDGGMLTDTIMLVSLDQTTKKGSMVSIPRDLYVRITSEKQDKINSAYENLGLSGVKKLVSQITGVYIDYAVVFDFSAFKEIVDTLGGVDITLDKPFTEQSQWGYEFSLPAGQNHLTGETALYYVRSRYSTSDFDRAWRQQQVIMAIKQKALSLNILSDPGNILNLMNIVRKHMKTDYNLSNISGMIQLTEQLNGSKIRRSVLTTENFLTEDHVNGMYVLLPFGGNFQELKKYFASVCSDTPTSAPRRSPSASSGASPSPSK
jgi:LCP family protein required for cell wall assembly